MEYFGTIIDYLGRTNLFNFIIFLSIIILIAKKANVGKLLDNAKNDIEKSIHNAEETKVESENALQQAEDLYANLQNEIDIILKESDENAQLVGKKIIENANKTVETLQENTHKIIENNTALMRNDILNRASSASVEMAKRHIINELNNNGELHEKLINESIEALNGVDF